MFKQIDMAKLVAHSDAPSRMSRGMVKKLGQSIQTIGHCGAVVVRPLHDDYYQILDGHSRVESLRTLGRKRVTSDVWDIDDDMARLFIAASSSVKGVSVPELRIGLLFDLLERFSPAELGGMLPESEAQLSRLLAFAAEGGESDWSESPLSVTDGLSTGKSTTTPKGAEEITMTLRMTRAQYTMIKCLLQGFMQRAKIQDMVKRSHGICSIKLDKGKDATV